VSGVLVSKVKLPDTGEPTSTIESNAGFTASTSPVYS
jgi:hypothetical protein